MRMKWDGRSGNDSGKALWWRVARGPTPEGLRVLWTRSLGILRLAWAVVPRQDWFFKQCQTERSEEELYLWEQQPNVCGPSFLLGRMAVSNRTLLSFL